MFTLEKATQIFPDTLSADVVPAITARFRLLNAEDQLALIWYAYLEMGNTDCYSYYYEKMNIHYLGALYFPRLY